MQSRRYASDRVAGCHVASDDGSCSDERIGANRHATKYDGAGTNAGTAPDSRGNDHPIGLRGQPASDSGPGVPIVDENNTMTEEYIVFDCNPFAQEAVRGNLAACADVDAALNFHERPNRGVAADPTAVKVDQVPVVQNHARFQYDVGCHRHGIVLFN